MLSWLPRENHIWCAADVITPLVRDESGSARIPRAGEGLWRSRTFLRSPKIVSGNTVQEKFVSAERRNQHTRRVRYPSHDDLT